MIAQNPENHAVCASEIVEHRGDERVERDLVVAFDERSRSGRSTTNYLIEGFVQVASLCAQNCVSEITARALMSAQLHALNSERERRSEQVSEERNRFSRQDGRVESLTIHILIE